MNAPVRKRGMVLLEVIVALALFAGVAFSLVLALDAATEAGVDRNRMDAVTLGLENRMAQIQNGPLALTKRDLPDDGSGISYRLEVEPTSLQDDQQKNFNGFFRVTLRAKWDKDRESELSQLIYQP